MIDFESAVRLLDHLRFILLALMSVVSHSTLTVVVPNVLCVIQFSPS